MVFGIDDAILLGGTLAATGGSLFSAGQQRAQQGQAINQARAQYEGELALRRMMLERQYQLATAGQTDAYGNKLIYDPNSGWVSLPSAKGQELINRSDAINRMHDVETLGRGAMERSANFQRRLGESNTADTLLREISNRYGAPSREGVVGANKIAAATDASEAADNARSGFTAAALRTGTGAVPLEHTLASLDRGAVKGQRSALANVEAQASPLYNQMFSDWMTSKSQPYNLFATRASNTEDIPFAPQNITSTLDTIGLNRAARGTSGVNPYAGISAPSAGNQLLTQIGAQQQMPWGSAFGALTDIARIFSKRGSGIDPGSASTAFNDYATNRNRDPSYYGGGGF